MFYLYCPFRGSSGSWALASPVFGTVTALALLSGVYLAFELAAADRPAPKMRKLPHSGVV